MKCMNNEVVGISAELAIADVFNLYVNPRYRERGDEYIKDSLMNCVAYAFKEENLPTPIRHVAENKSLIDFELEDGKTLSVKTNKRKLDKVAPQRIGQPTSDTYFEYLSEAMDFDLQKELELLGLPDAYETRRSLFKYFSRTHIADLLPLYWEHLFECDYYIHFYNVVDGFDNPTGRARYLVLKDIPTSPRWDVTQITFTKTLEGWRESCTVKYMGTSIGEFQVHNNRDCLKFRFNIRGILYLLNNHLI